MVFIRPFTVKSKTWAIDERWQTFQPQFNNHDVKQLETKIFNAALRVSCFFFCVGIDTYPSCRNLKALVMQYLDSVPESPGKKLNKFMPCLRYDESQVCTLVLLHGRVSLVCSQKIITLFRSAINHRVVTTIKLFKCALIKIKSWWHAVFIIRVIFRFSNSSYYGKMIIQLQKLYGLYHLNVSRTSNQVHFRFKLMKNLIP